MIELFSSLFLNELTDWRMVNLTDVEGLLESSTNDEFIYYIINCITINQSQCIVCEFREQHVNYLQ